MLFLCLNCHLTGASVARSFSQREVSSCLGFPSHVAVVLFKTDITCFVCTPELLNCIRNATMNDMCIFYQSTCEQQILVQVIKPQYKRITTSMGICVCF